VEGERGDDDDDRRPLGYDPGAMVDHRLRTLARAAATAPDLEREARLLVERVRAGELAPDRVCAAAHVGDVAAAAACDRPPAVLPPLQHWRPEAPESSGRLHARPEEAEGPGELEAWAAELWRACPEAGVRAALACAEAVLGRWVEARLHDHRPQAVLEAVRAWLDEPTDERATAAAELGRSLGLDVDDGSWPELPPEDRARLCCAYAGTALLPPDDRVVEGGGGSSCGACVGAAAGLLGTAAVVELVRSAVVPWALAPGGCSVTARGGSSRPTATRSGDSLPSPAPVTRCRHRAPSQPSQRTRRAGRPGGAP
jgi:hypothetical protein